MNDKDKQFKKRIEMVEKLGCSANDTLILNILMAIEYNRPTTFDEHYKEVLENKKRESREAK